jgi:Transposase
MTHCSWAGIDLHRSRSQVAVLDDHGTELVSRRIANYRETFLELLAEIDGESKIALEATYGWEWLADVLDDAAYELHLSHPLAHQGDRRGARQERCRRRAHARAPAPHRTTTRGLHRPA